MKQGLTLVAALALLAAAGCRSSGGLSGPERTGTAEGRLHAATATAIASSGRPVTMQDVADVINVGFIGLEIDYTATTIDTFRKPDELLPVLADCDQGRGHGMAQGDQGYWPAVLGDCYAVGDATKWLYEYTGKREFAYANQLMKRLMKQKIDEANADGASLGESYWDGVVAKVYTLTPGGTPVAVTPQPAAD